MLSKGNSFYFGNEDTHYMNGRYSIKDNMIYEFNTDTGDASVFFTDDILGKKQNPVIEIYEDYLLLTCKGINKLDDYFSVIDISDGNKIVDDRQFYSPYLGGDCSFYRNLATNTWYKLRYPDSTYQGKLDKAKLIEAGEEVSDEEASIMNGQYIIQLDSKYYVYYDNVGYFLRTYEKGSSEEKLIITRKQIEEEQNKDEENM